MIYRVNYQVSENIWSGNIAIAESKEAVQAYYAKKSERVLIDEGTENDRRAAERKGKPVVVIEAEAETETEETYTEETYTQEEAEAAILKYFEEKTDEFEEAIEERAGYTAEDYIRDCEDNADADWIETLHRGAVELEEV